jgi:hypothetical protein
LLSIKLVVSSANEDIVVSDPQNPIATKREYFVSKFQIIDNTENIPKIKLPIILTVNTLIGSAPSIIGEDTTLYPVAETHLQAILTELESETGNFILYSKDDDIDVDTKMRIRSHANMMFKQIRDLKVICELKTNEKRSSKRIILGHLLEIWDTIEELGPTGMRSYGSMSKADEDDLTTIVEKLIIQHENILKEVSSVNR